MYLWGWHPSQIGRMNLSDFWMTVDVVDQIARDNKKKRGGHG
jgi:hypothetical protein